LNATPTPVLNSEREVVKVVLRFKEESYPWESKTSPAGALGAISTPPTVAFAY
jgi:hypothetical protein